MSEPIHWKRQKRIQECARAARREVLVSAKAAENGDPQQAREHVRTAEECLTRLRANLDSEDRT